jgi:ketosteroid isomerase-like protein
MAFKLTYTDGQESDYDDGTKWKVEDGVLKLGREDGEWTVFVSPGHWATIELVKGKQNDRDDKRDKAKDKDADRDGKDEKEYDKEDKEEKDAD